MTLSRKERMRRAILHQPVDRLPTQINYTAAMGERLAAHFQVTPAELPDRLGNHVLRLDLTYPQRLSQDGKVRFDWWGVGFSTEEEGYFPSVSPLAESNDLDHFPWPDPHAPGLLDEASAAIAVGSDHFLVPNFGFCLFERAWTLRGFETFLMDTALNPGFAAELLDRIVDIQLVLIRRFIDLGLDGGYFGDDYGAQKNLLFSPISWRQLAKPRLARLFAPFKEEGLPVILHSDGQIATILPDLLEIGLKVLNPVQPEVIDHHWLRDTFSRELAYYGGVSTQTVLPRSAPEEVRAAVAACVDALAPDGTGLVIAPSHRMMTDIPMANAEALLAAFSALDELK